MLGEPKMSVADVRLDDDAQDNRGHNSVDFRHISVMPVAGACGAEIGRVDLNTLDAETVEEVRRAFLAHKVIFVRDQTLTPETHKALGRHFGTLNIHPQYVHLDGDEEILPIVKEPTDQHNIGGVWHSDVTFLERPALGSMLYGIEVPAVGGDTMFADQQAAYDALSVGMKEMLDGLMALHSDRTLSDPAEVARRNATRSTKITAEATGKPPIENLHPVVRTHPDTGRKGLFVNKAFTLRFDGMTEEESKPLLDFLYVHAVRPEFTCRFRWMPGSLAFWDNRCLMHYALNDYPGERRYMHRVTVDGDRPD
jgi:alpha-ketoglutarate-dependent taurine dioxygenase